MTQKSDWNPTQYARFRDERSQPFFDLLALVEKRPTPRAVDLGCGTGELTAKLHAVLGARETLGIDSSPAMLEKSAAHAAPALSFALGDIGEIPLEGPYDLIFSNAALHWLPDHPALFARLTRALAPDGQLAVQMPANHDHPSHTVAAEVAGESPFREALGGYARQVSMLAPEAYATLLHALGFARQHVRLQVYGHLLATRGDVVEWVKGTLLTDYQRRLPDDLYPLFLERYRARLLPLLGDRDPCFYPFKRILLWAAR
jgi:trans-aconitate 2-methyltransferase